MHHWPKRLLVIAVAVSLSSCLWGPGKFVSDLTLKRDGTFVLDYRGEIVLQLPPDADEATKPWASTMAHCSDDKGKDRDCSTEEIATQKSDYEKQAADKRKQAEQMAKAFGLPGLDDESNRQFAARLMKYAGYRSVTYRAGRARVDLTGLSAGRHALVFSAGGRPIVVPRVSDSPVRLVPPTARSEIKMSWMSRRLSSAGIGSAPWKLFSS